MQALILLKQDHGNVENFFRRYEEAREDLEERARVRDLIVEHLSVHAAIEEQVFYPAVIDRLAEEQREKVLEDLEEHHIVKWSLSELDDMAPTDPRFDAKMTVLIENVRHHVQEEENDLFEQARQAFTVEELEELGEQMEKAKAVAPTRPHPRTPDTPPLNILIGLPIAVADRAFTTGKEVVGKLIRRAG